MIGRREFIALFGGVAAAWPLAAPAQQPTLPVIASSSSRSASTTGHLVAAFREGLKAGGYIEGENVLIAYRWADGPYDRLPALAAELIELRPAVIAATGGSPAALAAKALIHDWRRSSFIWSRHQLQPANRQRNGHICPHYAAGAETAGGAARIDAGVREDRRPS